MFEQILKNMGFDPATIKKQVDEASANFQKVVQHFDSRLNSIESKQDEIIQLFKEQKK